MACPLGGLLVGYLLDRIGRKNTILFTNLLGILGWLLLALAPLQSDNESVYIQMLVARFISGECFSKIFKLHHQTLENRWSDL